MDPFEEATPSAPPLSPEDITYVLHRFSEEEEEILIKLIEKRAEFLEKTASKEEKGLKRPYLIDVPESNCKKEKHVEDYWGEEEKEEEPKPGKALAEAMAKFYDLDDLRVYSDEEDFQDYGPPAMDYYGPAKPEPEPAKPKPAEPAPERHDPARTVTFATQVATVIPIIRPLPRLEDLPSTSGYTHQDAVRSSQAQIDEWDELMEIYWEREWGYHRHRF